MRVRSALVASVVSLAAVAASCTDSEESSSNPGSGGTDAGLGGAAGSSGSGGAAGSDAAAGMAGSAGTSSSFGRCGDPAPAGAASPPAPPSYSSGTCPTLVAGANTLATKGGERKLILVLPKDLKADEHPPVIFLWHWLGGDAQSFVEQGEIQAAADAQRFIAVVPQKKGDLLFVWPVETIQSQARVDEELGFFDDMLSCVDAQFAIDRSCVASAGVSAGALFTDQLAGARGEFLSSFISLSGGVGGVIRPWNTPKHALPALVLWGGPKDTCIGLLSFETMSQTLENELAEDGSFFIECVHNCGHSEPPLSGPTSKFQGLWDFVLDHPYWTPSGQSPYQSQGLPAALPSWCGIGKASASPPAAACANPSQC